MLTVLAGTPQALGKYEIQGVLGRGGMGIVYKGYDADIDRPVAIKVVHAHLVEDGTKGDLLQRFRQEARAAARCVHPNIVTLFDFGVSDLGPYMVMEYVEGLDLRALLKAGRQLPLRQRADIILQVLAALDFAHKQGVIHRDIKPANILLLDNGSVKVTDFGVAKLDTSELTNLGDMIGTPTYMSPEARLGAPVDTRADLYTVGVVLLELVAGKRPNPDQLAPEDVSAALGAAILGATERRGFEKLLVKALQLSPGERFQTADEFAADLKRVLAPDTVYQPATGELAVTIVETKRLFSERVLGRQAAEGTVLSSASQFTPAPEVTSLLNASLARHLGPVSSRVIRAAVAQSTGLEDLVQKLAMRIPNADERAEFVRGIERHGVYRMSSVIGAPRCTPTPAPTPSPTGAGAGPVPSSTASGAGAGPRFSHAELAQVADQLAVHVGPLAGHLVKRAAKQAGDMRQLYQILAQRIDDERERATFLARCRW
jgi:serine/threonine protein kinase